MASCMGMTSSNEIRLVMPPGPVCQAALSEGAVKVALRQGLAHSTATNLGELVELAAIAINTTTPASIELTIDPDQTNLMVRLVGHHPMTEPDSAAFDELATSASDATSHYTCDPASPQVTFEFLRN